MGHELMGRELMSHESNLQLFLLCDSDTRQWYKAHLLEIETFRYITNGWFQKYPPLPHGGSLEIPGGSRGPNLLGVWGRGVRGVIYFQRVQEHCPRETYQNRIFAI